LASEIVAVNDTEDALVDVEVTTDGQILPGIVVCGLINDRCRGLGHDMTLQEDSLGDARVLDAGLNDVQGVVLKIVEDNALTEAVVFVGVFSNGLLEVGVEFEDLAVMLEPLGSDLGHSIVNLGRAPWHTGESSGGSIAHGHEL
jgi:hypothetical protein